MWASFRNVLKKAGQAILWSNAAYLFSGVHLNACNDKPNTFCTSRPELVFNPVALSRHTEQSLVCEHCSIDLHKSVMCLSKIFLTEIYIELFKVISDLIQVAPCNIQIHNCLPVPAPTAVPACSVLSAVKPIALKCQTHGLVMNSHTLM